MRELDVCQHFSDQLAPSCPDQDDISVWSNADGNSLFSSRSAPTGVAVKRAAPQDRPGVIRHSDVIHPDPWGLSCWSPCQDEPLPGIGQMRGNARRCLLQGPPRRGGSPPCGKRAPAAWKPVCQGDYAVTVKQITPELLTALRAVDVLSDRIQLYFMETPESRAPNVSGMMTARLWLTIARHPAVKCCVGLSIIWSANRGGRCSSSSLCDASEQRSDDDTDQRIGCCQQDVGGRVSRPLPGIENGRCDQQSSGGNHDDGYGDDAEPGRHHHSGLLLASVAGVLAVLAIARLRRSS
jgi:hypothetical protein